MVPNVKLALSLLLQEASLNITDTNRRTAEQFNEAFNRGDLDAAASCLAEDCENHGKKVGRTGDNTRKALFGDHQFLLAVLFRLRPALILASFVLPPTPPLCHRVGSGTPSTGSSTVLLIFLFRTPHDSEQVATFAGRYQSAPFQRLDGIAIGR